MKALKNPESRSLCLSTREVCSALDGVPGAVPSYPVLVAAMAGPHDRPSSDFPTGSGLAGTDLGDTRADRNTAPDAGTPRALPRGALVNGRYRIDEFLGAGGMGAVYRVTDTLAPDRPLALKTIREDAVTADRIDLFKAEFRTMTGFRHPNVASVYDFEPVHGTGGFLFTMEFVDGRDVFSATVGADRETVLDLVVGICRALAYVHSRGVVHLDLKPSNLLVSTLGRVKVLDFGVARTAREATGRRLIGTPAYMAPELAGSATPDPRSDLYSLGIVLYQLFTRRLPFEADRIGDVLRMHAQDPIPFDRPEARDLPPWICTLIDGLCRKEPAERFRGANAVIEAINRHGGRAYELETPQTRESYILSSRFIGRGPELQRVVDFIMDRTQGSNTSPPVLLVTGSSGVGKSRLIREARHRTQLSGLAFVETQCYERNVSDYGPLGDAVKQLVRLAAAAGADDVGRAAPPELAGFPETAEPRGQIESAERQRLRLREEATEFLVNLAGTVPYVLCVNDLQWAQPGFVDLLVHLARRLSIARRARARVPMAFLATFRDEEIAGRPCESLIAELNQWHAADMMGLAPLERAAVGEIVASMLGADPPAAFVDRLARESGGVPFFVEEVMRALVENGSVYVEGGAWAAAHDIPHLPIPTSVMNVLARRVDALEVPARAVLTVLAAEGRPATARLLAAATGLDPTDFGEAVNRLLQRRMMVDLPGDPIMYSVAHDRIREMVYGSLSVESRQSVHRSIARAIESTGDTERDEHVYELAQHWWLAGDRPHAFRYSRRGAARAWSTYSNDLAIELYGHVLELADDDDLALRLEITEKLGDLHALNGRFDDALARYREVMAAVSEARELARLLRKTGNVYWQRGELVAAVDWLWQAAVALGDRRPVSRPAQAVALVGAVLTHLAHRLRPPRAHVDNTEQARLLELTATYFQLGEVYFFHDSSQMLLPILRASNAGERAGGDSAELCRAYHAVMVLYGTLTWWRSAGMYARRLTGMAEQLASPWQIGAAHTYRLILHYYRSEWREGIEHGRRGRELLQRCGDVMELSFACWVTALCYFHCGELRAGGEWAHDVLDMMQRFGSEQPTKGILAVCGRINARLGRVAEARGQIERSLALAHQARDLMFVAWTQMMMGDCLLIAGQTDQAVVWLENARRVREDNALLPEYLVEIYSLLALARLEQLDTETHLHEWQRRRRLRTIAAIARRAMRLSRRRRHHYVPALRAAALCAWRRGKRRRAVRLFERSLHVADQIGSPLQWAETSEAWGRCLLGSGDHRGARDHLERAAVIYEEAGAAAFAARAQAPLKS